MNANSGTPMTVRSNRIVLLESAPTLPSAATRRSHDCAALEFQAAMAKGITNSSVTLIEITVSQGKSGGGVLFFVACSNANASSMSRGSLHANPVKLTLNGAGLGSNPAGNVAAAAPGPVGG